MFCNKIWLICDDFYFYVCVFLYVDKTLVKSFCCSFLCKYEFNCFEAPEKEEETNEIQEEEKIKG